MTTVHPVRSAGTVGVLIQEWRQRRHLSQLALATEAGVSTRHLCFVETGRAKPSRAMILHLAGVLDVPLRERNALLLAAGFAPIYSETDLADPDLGPIHDALDAMLQQQEPYPAVVLDRRGDILRTNRAGERLFAWLLEGQPPIAGRPNLLRLFFHPGGLRPFVVDWEQVAGHLLHRLQREALGGSPDEPSRLLLSELLSYPDAPRKLASQVVSRPLLPVVPVVFCKGALRFDYFSAITTLGTPQDVTLQEIRVESLFPMNEETRSNARRLLA